LGAPRWLLKWNPELGESQAAKREGIEREREREEEEEKDVLITEFLISERTNEWSDVVVVVVLCSRSKRKWRLARAKDENEIRSRRLQQSLGGGSSSSR
jgi:hypothetical protein